MRGGGTMKQWFKAVAVLCLTTGLAACAVPDRQPQLEAIQSNIDATYEGEFGALLYNIYQAGQKAEEAADAKAHLESDPPYLANHGLGGPRVARRKNVDFTGNVEVVRALGEAGFEHGRRGVSKRTCAVKNQTTPGDRRPEGGGIVQPARYWGCPETVRKGLDGLAVASGERRPKAPAGRLLGDQPPCISIGSVDEPVRFGGRRCGSHGFREAAESSRAAAV